MGSNVKSKDPLGIIDGYTPAEDYSPSDDERELASAIHDKFDKASRQKLIYERQWEFNQFFIKGQQLLIRNNITNEVMRLPRTNNQRHYSVNNIIRKTARALLGEMTRTIPTCFIIPPTSDLSDLKGAQTADSLLSFYRRKEKLDADYIELNRDLGRFGTGFIKLCWDKLDGDINAYCPECGYKGGEDMISGECPMCSMELDLYQDMSMTLPIMTGFRDGGIRSDVIDPRDIFIDSSVSSLDNAQWFIYRTPLPINVIREQFPDRGMYVHAENGIYTDRYISISHDVLNTVNYGNIDDHAYLFEYQERPSLKYPMGRIIFVADNVILGDFDNPYYSSLKRFPLYAFFFERNKGEFWGESFIESAWQKQQELNTLLTQMREHRDLTNNPRAFVPQISNISEEEFLTSKIIHYNHMGGKPSYGEIPSFPTYTYNEIARFEQGIKDDASVTGQTTATSDVSGRYAAIIQAEASQQLGPIIRLNNIEWSEFHRGMIILTQKYASDDFVWTIEGSDGPKTFYFKDMNLNPGWDIDVQQDDALSTNHALRLQQTSELARLGLFTNPDDGKFRIKEFARVAKLKLPFIGPDADSSERMTAQAIPNRLEHGIRYEPKPWDSAKIFAEELLAWLRGPGRNAEKRLVDEVSDLWMYYMEVLQGSSRLPEQPPSSIGRQNHQQPTPSMGPGQPPSPIMSLQPAMSGVLPASNEIIKGADQMAETTARSQEPHEG